MLATNITGEPYEGKLHVRFDEGILKCENKERTNNN